MNPTFSITNQGQLQIPSIAGGHDFAPLQLPQNDYLKFDLQSGQFYTQTPAQDVTQAQQALADPLGIKTFADRFQSQFDSQIPNYAVGIVGLVLIFVGITSLSAPAAAAVAKVIP